MVKRITIDGLAQMVAKGFAGVDEHFKAVDRRFNQMATKEDLKAVKADLGGKIDALDTKTNRMEGDISDVKDSLIPKLDFEDLEGRVKYVEKKLAIESGK